MRQRSWVVVGILFAMAGCGGGGSGGGGGHGGTGGTGGTGGSGGGTPSGSVTFTPTSALVDGTHLPPNTGTVEIDVADYPLSCPIGGSQNVPTSLDKHYLSIQLNPPDGMTVMPGAFSVDMSGGANSAVVTINTDAYGYIGQSGTVTVSSVGGNGVSGMYSMEVVAPGTSGSSTSVGGTIPPETVCP